MQACLLAGAVGAMAPDLHANVQESSVGYRLAEHGLAGT